MSRFFVNPNDITGNSIKITGEDVSHIKKVLRLKEGESIIVCDGMGNDYTVRIESFAPEYIETGIIDKRVSRTEPPIDITLFQGLPKSDKMDLIIQKCVEMGVNKIIPVLTEHTVVKIDNKKDVENKVSRWQRIALEAAKQCNRGRIPIVGIPIKFGESLEIARHSQLAIIPYEKESETGLRGCIQNGVKSISVMIGPEGGFSEDEIEKALLLQVKPVTLGPRILRTETAGIAVISILMYELGDIGG